MGAKVYVKRNEKNEIIAISKIEIPEFSEMLNIDDSEIIAFLNNSQIINNESYKNLIQSDLEMIRVLEDLIQLLIDKNIIKLTELPDAAQEKLLNRDELRSTISDLFNSDSEEGYDEDINI